MRPQYYASCLLVSQIEGAAFAVSSGQAKRLIVASLQPFLRLTWLFKLLPL